VSGPISALAEQFWTGAVPAGQLWKPTGQVEEMAPGVFFLHTFANMTLVRTGTGVVLIDTSNHAARDKTFALVRSIDTAPVVAAIYTHGHADHALGLPPFLAETRERGWPRPRIVGHRNVAARFERYRRTNGYNALINARQFGIAPAWPRDYDDPDLVYDTTLTFAAGDVRLELTHARGETDDHTWVYAPERRVLCTGDLFIWASPNCGNPQKVQRYPKDWATALRTMRGLDAEVLLPGHGLPVIGSDRVREALDDTATLLELLHDETLAMMNAGATLDDIVNTVHAPPYLLEKPYLRPVYDEPEFVVRNVWRLYGGWFDGDPAHLKPAPAVTIAREVATLAGGARAVADRALSVADAGDLRLAAQLAEWAALAAPDDADVQRARADVYARRVAAESSTMAKGVFRWAERESRARS
jgi:alkyl sulfatase BDS1-like metallo-beta-lactamase superfamily hydrolase